MPPTSAVPIIWKEFKPAVTTTSVTANSVSANMITLVSPLSAFINIWGRMKKCNRAMTDVNCGILTDYHKLLSPHIPVQVILPG